MSWVKGDGAKIKITFDKALIGDIPGESIRTYLPDAFHGTATVSDYHGDGYNVEQAMDNNLSTYWITSNASSGNSWMKFNFGSEIAFPKFMLYFPVPSQIPSSMQLQGSDDGVTWANLETYTSITLESAGWKEFSTANTEKYVYYRLNFLVATSWMIRIAEVKFFTKASDNNAHFTVTAKEYDYVPNGTLKDVVKPVFSVSAGDTNKDVVLEMYGTTRFESAVELTVAYDGLGTLSGSTGNVEAFFQSFTPQELAPKPDQNNQEHIKIASVSSNSNLIKLYYSSAKAADEHVSLSSITGICTLTNIHDL